ncbi:sugar phosphate isomerase/epimerase family protein [Alkalihalobacillus sp. BA299]|uniref:sugar phosphate isomerase/epimerase family protein n=1 Tax=Alkalihalobacillus sp. BA299 TaxID=2815938 RepID=UPI001ADD4C89|nr:sugar phosphate isomerase/epimerase family protein [Alkalihalobacillus sp. BA299]
MFKIGSSSELLRNYSLQEATIIFSALGYDVVELWMGHFYKSNLKATEIKSLMKNNNLDFQIHADVRDVNLTSTNQGIRDESLKQMLETIELASEMEAPVVTLHPGRMSSSKDLPDDFWELQLDMFSKIASHAEKYGVNVGVENMEKRSKEFVVTLNDVTKLIRGVNSSHLGLTMDLAHYHSIGDVKTFVQQVDLPIMNVHISQAAPGKMHLPFSAQTEDTINFDEVLPELIKKYQGPLIIEGYVHGKELETVKENYQWLSQCMELCK